MHTHQPKASDILRFSIVIEWVLTGMYIVSVFALESQLPIPLQHWISSQYEQASGGAAFAAILSIPLIAAYIAGSIALFLLKRWGVWLYVCSIIVGTLMVLTQGPVVEHALASTLGDMAGLATGFVFGVIFLKSPFRS